MFLFEVVLFRIGAIHGLVFFRVFVRFSDGHPYTFTTKSSPPGGIIVSHDHELKTSASQELICTFITV